jgi:hypothetical protein
VSIAICRPLFLFVGLVIVGRCVIDIWLAISRKFINAVSRKLVGELIQQLHDM